MQFKTIDGFENAKKAITAGKEVYIIVPMTENTTIKDLMNAAGYVEFDASDKEEKKEPAAEEKKAEPAVKDPTKEKPKGKKKRVDPYQIRSLAMAGWTRKQIAEEIGVSEASIYAHIKKLKERGEWWQ